jgi:trans-aconitate methyltransferase
MTASSSHRGKPIDVSELRELRDTWEAFGRDDPLWAVLTRPGTRGGRWDPAAFLATGEAEIGNALEALRRLDINPPRGRALDFGCGAGRLTRALASRFDTVVGLDVAETMLEAARQLNPDLVNVEWIHNARGDLGLIHDRSIDFIYSRLVLQHIPSELSIGYIREFARILGADGVAAFQVPAARPKTAAWRRAARWLRGRLSRRPRMGSYAVSRPAVVTALAAGGAIIVAELPDTTGTMYVVRLTGC